MCDLFVTNRPLRVNLLDSTFVLIGVNFLGLNVKYTLTLISKR